MTARLRKPARSAAGAKPNAVARQRRAERLWELYVKAFEGLLGAHRRVPDEEWAISGDREWQSARAIADGAMQLALCAAHKFENYARRNPTPKRTQGRSRRIIAAAEEALPAKKEAKPPNK
jgi:hypothetical protein